MSESPILVTGGTGKQGGAAARALLARGVPVRALVRDSAAPAAQVLSALGAELVRGDLNDPASLAVATAGARGVFSIQYPTADPDEEPRQGRNLVAAARAAGVQHFVQTSVTGTLQYRRDHESWPPGIWEPSYWAGKVAVEDAVMDAGFERWTIIRPAFFMENLPYLLRGDQFVTAYAPDRPLPVVAVQDIGEACAIAITRHERLDHVAFDLAGELWTMPQMAQILSEVWGRPLTAPTLSVDACVAAGVMEGMAMGQVWHNLVGMPARPQTAAELGIPQTALRDWAKAHAPSS